MGAGQHASTTFISPLLHASLNLLLFYPDMEENELDLVEAEQRLQARESHKGGESRDHSGILMRQAFGPLKKMPLPTDIKRTSRFKLWEMYLQDKNIAVAVGFNFLLPLACTDPDTALDEVPLTCLPILACSPIEEHAFVQANHGDT